MAVTFLLSGGAAVLFAYGLADGLPGRESLRSARDMASATTLYDARDQRVFTIFKEQRIEVPLSRVAPELVRAVVAVEDQRFFQHQGVDAFRVVAAGLANLREGRAAQGASTITQQLARQSFLSSDKTLRRKLREIILATRLERLYSKEEILELYLNKVYLGDGLYGAEAAAIGYFGKHASELTLDEAALIAGLVKSPSTYAPTISLERATVRRSIVLASMVQAGMISEEERKAANQAPVRLQNGFEGNERFGLYFKEQVRRELVERFGWATVYGGGLQVYTTLDAGAQRQAEEAVAASLEAIEARRAKAAARRARGKVNKVTAEAEADADPLQAALVALDPTTGDVRALVGGRSFADSSFNRATQARRQPGSAFKPFVYAVAVENGYSPASLIHGLDAPVMTLQGEWTPEDEHVTSEAITLRAALRTSSNRAAVRMLEEVGVKATVEYAKRLGIAGMPSVPSLALGSGEVTLLSLASAYVPFADKGRAHQPRFIRRVEDRQGQVLWEAEPESRRVMEETTAFLMSQMLADVVNAGTAARVRTLGFRLPAAGKTGTTNDYHDAWFVGFTPKLLAGVWVGFDHPRTIIADGYAADLAVPMWARFMRAATEGDEPVWIERPRGIVAVPVCRLSGFLPTKGCENARVDTSEGLEIRSLVYTEYFKRGTEPVEECPIHRSSSFFDRLAGIFGREDDAQPAPTEGVTLGPDLPPPAAPSVAAKEPELEPKAEEREVVDGEKKKKRGFWSRLFGIGGDDDDDDEKKKRDDEKKKEEQRRKEEARKGARKDPNKKQSP